MKISKLFHWLYAFIMLMPIFAIGSVILVNTFNNQAKQENETIINYEYETNEVNSEEDLIKGNIYTLHIDTNNRSLFELTPNTDSSFFINLVNTDKEIYFDSLILDDTILNYIYGFNYNNIYLNIYKDDATSIQELNVYGSDYQYFYNDYSLRYYFEDLLDVYHDYSAFNIDFILLDFNDIATFIDVDLYICECENIPIESVEIVEKDLDNVFYKSIEQVQNSNIFNWAMSSFLVTPFSYIVGLFGMPINNVVVLLLSYWLDISIIWLVFDLIMYVPLLVHRWIDKAGIE